MLRIRSSLLRQLRAEKGLSINNAAALAGKGVYRRFLRDLEQGKDITISINQLRQLGDLYGYPGIQCWRLIYDTELGYDHDLLAPLPKQTAAAPAEVAG